METMRGIAAHLAQLPRGLNHLVISYYIFPAVGATFYGLFLLVLLVHYVWWYRKQWNGIAVVSIGVLLALAWSLAVSSPNHSYNLLAFSLLLLAVALHLLAALDQPVPQPVAPRWRKIIYGLYFSLFALMSLGVTRQAAVFAVFRKHGVSYGDARAHLRKLLPATSETPILFDGGLWPLLDRFDHAYRRTADDCAVVEPTPGLEKPDIIIYQW